MASTGPEAADGQDGAAVDAVVDTYVLAVAVNAVMGHRGAEAGVIAKEIGITAAQLSQLRYNRQMGPANVIRVLMWLNLPPRSFAPGHTVTTTLVRSAQVPTGGAASPAA